MLFQLRGDRAFTQGELRRMELELEPWRRTMYSRTARDRILKKLFERDLNVGRLPSGLRTTASNSRAGGIDVFMENGRFGWDLTTSKEWAMGGNQRKCCELYGVVLQLLCC